MDRFPRLTCRSRFSPPRSPVPGAAARASRGSLHRASGCRAHARAPAARRGQSKQASIICIATSAPMPAKGQPSSSVTRRLVLRTELRDGLGVQRADRAQVDHLGADALLGQRLGRLHRHADHDGEGDDGDVGAFAFHLGLADRQDEIIVRRAFEAVAVHDLVLEEDHRVRVADGGAQQALGIGGDSTAPRPSAPGNARTSSHSIASAARRRGRPRRSDRGRRSGSPAGRPTCTASWRPN